MSTLIALLTLLLKDETAVSVSMTNNVWHLESTGYRITVEPKPSIIPFTGGTNLWIYKNYIYTNYTMTNYITVPQPGITSPGIMPNLAPNVYYSDPRLDAVAIGLDFNGNIITNHMHIP